MLNPDAVLKGKRITNLLRPLAMANCTVFPKKYMAMDWCRSAVLSLLQVFCLVLLSHFKIRYEDQEVNSWKHFLSYFVNIIETHCGRRPQESTLSRLLGQRAPPRACNNLKAGIRNSSLLSCVVIHPTSSVSSRLFIIKQAFHSEIPLLKKYRPDQLNPLCQRH